MSEKTASKLKNNMGRLVILTTAGSLIYGLPYFRSYYYDAYLEVYHLTNTQMGTFGSIFGVLGAISYLFGGIVADMISPRMIMSVSLILTGAAGLLHLTNPSYGILVLIYLIWGFTSLLLRKMSRAKPSVSWKAAAESSTHCIWQLPWQSSISSAKPPETWPA